MRRVLSAFAVAATVAGAHAADLSYPFTTVLQNSKGNDALNVECDPPNDTQMRCHFVKLDVTRKTPGEVPKFTAADCAGVDVLSKAIRDGVPPPGTDPEAFRDRQASQDPRQKADNIAFADAFEAFCAKPEPANSDALGKLVRERESRICTVSISTYDLDFTYSQTSGNWESLGVPNACAVAPLGSFEQVKGGPANAPWSYRLGSRVMQTLVAPKTGCAAEPNTLYTWQPADLYLACDYLRFTN